MKRHTLPERSNWRAKAEEYGFPFHTIDGEIYWDETVAWSFTLAQIEEDIEAPTVELEQMCLAFAGEAIGKDSILRQLDIPDAQWSFIRESWKRGDRNLYGRFDLAYDGSGPAKLLEYNADTPTALFEAAVFQWTWLEDQMAAGVIPVKSDQFNSLHERLVSAFKNIRKGSHYRLHLSAIEDSQEDEATVLYLADCARQAGLETKVLPIEQIGVNANGQFTDLEDELIQVLFKLYPWEWLLREDFARHFPAARTQFIEPPWKALLSSKGLLPLLWEMAPNHPNLLPSYFSDDLRAKTLTDYVHKPVHSREGANITIHQQGRIVEASEGQYGGRSVVQQLATLARYDGGHAVIGSWVVASEASGIGIREGSGSITKNNARFVPHFIAPE